MQYKNKSDLKIEISKLPFGAKSAFFLTSDDLNPAFIGDKDKLYFKPDIALENLEKAGKLLNQYNLCISYGFVPEYSHKENSSLYKIVNFKEDCFFKWNLELSEQIRKGICSLFAHGRYHLNDFAKPTGGFEDESDWKYTKEIIEKNFRQNTLTFRSPGYCYKKSEDWKYSDYLEALKRAGYLILLDKAYGFYHPNEIGYLKNTAEPDRLRKYDVLNFRKFIPEKVKFFIKNILKSSSEISTKTNKLFSISTYRDTEFNKGQYGNAYERLKLSYEKGDFIQESILHIYFHLKEYWQILEKIASFISSKGVNSFGGVWQPKTAEEVKNWFDLVLLENYNINIKRVNSAASVEINSPLKLRDHLITLKIKTGHDKPIKLNIDTKAVLQKTNINKNEFLITLLLNTNPFIFEIL